MSETIPSFCPPEWSCAPTAANENACFDVFKNSKKCGRLALAKRQVTILGRDQELSHYILANPSVSRHHAALVHDAGGGIYIIDLMSRHGTFIGRRKLPPYNPELLHEGDVVRFGQSSRFYIFKDADPKGLSAPVKKSWPKIHLTSTKKKNDPDHSNNEATTISTAKKPPVHYSPPVVKLINSIVRQSNASSDHFKEFCDQVNELPTPEEKKEAVQLIMEKVSVRYDFQASLIQRNALKGIITLIKACIGVSYFEDNLGAISQISQSKNDSEARTLSRKILQLLAEIKLDLELRKSLSPRRSCSPSIATAAPVELDSSLNDQKKTLTRDRVLSDEGRKLFYNSHALIANSNRFNSSVDSNINSSHCKSFEEQETNLNNDDDSECNDWRSRSRTLSNEQNGSGFGFMHQEHPVSDISSVDKKEINEDNTVSEYNINEEEVPSAFSFMAAAPGDNSSELTDVDDGETDINDDSNDVGLGTETFIVPAGFVAEVPSMQATEFEGYWQASQHYEKWNSDLNCLPNEEMLAQLLKDQLNMMCLASGEVDGVIKFFFYAEQASNGTILMAEVEITASILHMCVTFKWCEMALLYDEGHLLFIDYFKKILRPYTINASCESKNLKNQTVKQRSKLRSNSNRSSSSNKSNTFQMDLLKKVPYVEPEAFEYLWTSSTTSGEFDMDLDDIPSMEEIVETFSSCRFACLASGLVDDIQKFYFFAETESHPILYLIEFKVLISQQNVSAVVKMNTLADFQEQGQQIGQDLLFFLKNLIRNL